MLRKSTKRVKNYEHVVFVELERGVSEMTVQSSIFFRTIKQGLVARVRGVGGRKAGAFTRTPDAEHPHEVGGGSHSHPVWVAVGLRGRLPRFWFRVKLGLRGCVYRGVLTSGSHTPKPCCPCVSPSVLRLAVGGYGLT